MQLFEWLARCKKELPKVGEEVIAYCKNGENALVSMNENKFWKFDIGNVATDYVIAWRERPEYYEVKDETYD